MNDTSAELESEKAHVIPQPPTAEQKQTPPLPQGNWFNQQVQMIKAAVNAWLDDYAPSMGAALSYYTLFSLAPLLIIVIAVAGMVFGQEAAPMPNLATSAPVPSRQSE